MQVCEHIVIPNIRLRDDMEEMFEMNWVEYVRRDTEGSDNDTRRRAATDLVKALTARFEAQVGPDLHRSCSCTGRVYGVELSGPISHAPNLCPQPPYASADNLLHGPR